MLDIQARTADNQQKNEQEEAPSHYEWDGGAADCEEGADGRDLLVAAALRVDPGAAIDFGSKA